MFDTNRLEFDDEFVVEVPKEVLYDFMVRTWEITIKEFEKPEKIEIKKGKNELVYNFDTGMGVNHRKIIFHEPNNHGTKVTIHEKLPEINSFIFGPNQEHEAESLIVSLKIYFNSLEYIYKNDFSDAHSKTKISKSKKPFYMKEYSSSVGPDIDISPTYNFIKRRYQLFNEMKKGYPTFEDKKKSILVDEEERCLKIKIKQGFANLKTDYYFLKNNSGSYVDIRYRVPYLHLFPKRNRLEFKHTFRALRTMVKAFDHVYKKHMK